MYDLQIVSPPVGYLVTLLTVSFDVQRFLILMSLFFVAHA